MSYEIDVESWSDFKTLLSNKAGKIQYVTIGTDYVIWFIEDAMRYNYVIPITTPASSDQEDFEDNYKDNANQPILQGEEQVMTDLEIRDTDDHYSSVTDNRGYIPKTIYIENTLDQDIQVCVGGSRYSDFSSGVPTCGGEQTITAGETDYLTITDYFPYMKIKVSCTTAPTSGDVSVWVLRVKA